MKYPVTMTMGATTDTMHTLPSALYGLIPTLLMPKDRESTIFELPFFDNSIANEIRAKYSGGGISSNRDQRSNSHHTPYTELSMQHLISISSYG